MALSKIKLTKKEFDSFYEITGDTEATPETAPSEIPRKQDTTPEFLTEEEEAYDTKLFENYNIEEDIA